MGDSFYANDSAAIAVTGKIMVVAIIFLFLVVVFVLFLHLYAKWFWHRRQEAAAAVTTTTGRRSSLNFAPGAATGLAGGLDPTLLKSLPILTFNSTEFKDGLECAVCLSEVSNGEKPAFYPNAIMGFIWIALTCGSNPIPLAHCVETQFRPNQSLNPELRTQLLLLLLAFIQLSLRISLQMCCFGGTRLGLAVWARVWKKRMLLLLLLLNPLLLRLRLLRLMGVWLLIYLGKLMKRKK